MIGCCKMYKFYSLRERTFVKKGYYSNEQIMKKKNKYSVTESNSALKYQPRLLPLVCPPVPRDPLWEPTAGLSGGKSSSSSKDIDGLLI
jgi:hypothetical protein